MRSILKVILLCIIAACSYGVVHDQITASVCLEYFTVAHPPLFPTSSVTLLAFAWGIAATLGLGIVFGGVLALVSQSGDAPAYPISRLTPRILLLLAVMGLSATTAGLIGYQLFRKGLIALPADVAVVIPAVKQERFMGVWFAHCCSYLVGLTGGAFLCFRIWRARGRPKVLLVFPRTPGAMLRAASLAALTICIIWMKFRSH